VSDRNVSAWIAVNREGYDRIANDWDAARQAFYGRERAYLDTLLGGLPVPSEILDLGCGTGRPLGEYVIARGHRLTGVDQSGRLLERARERFPGAAWLEVGIETFVPAATVDGIICWDALFHIDRSIQSALFEKMAAWLSPGGRLMITVGGSEHAAFTDTMFGETFCYDSHPPDVVRAMLERAGFRIMVGEFMNLPDGKRDKGRYAFVAEHVGRPPP
jgi:SAM-dependent methyltransferase